MSELLDVVVVGAGPAGAVAALQLARAGAAVLLVDKAHFPRHKVCGGCVSASAARALAALGATLPAGPRLDALMLRAGKHRATLRLPGGLSISRAALDAALLELARSAGASVRTGARARLGPLGDGARVVHVGDDSVRARLVLAADGLGGALLGGGRVDPRSRVGVGARFDAPDVDGAPPAGTIAMVAGPGGYVGAVRDETGAVNVAAALDADLLRARGAAGAVDAILTSAGRPALPPATWSGTPPFTRRAAQPPERVLAIGDAAGYVEPFTGEGIGWAIATGIAVAPLALRGWSPELAERWERVRRRSVRRGACRAAAAVLRHPRLAAVLTAVLGRAPALAAPVVRAVHAAPVVRAEHAR